MRLWGAVPLGSIRGIQIRADWSLLVIFVLISVSLAESVFPAWHPAWAAALRWLTSLAAAVLFLGSVLLHELSHALVGRQRGVDIRRITLFMFGGMAEMQSEPPSWRAELAMTIVGPLTSLAIGLTCLWLVPLLSGQRLDPQHPLESLAALRPLPTLLLWLGPVNLVLGVFNLVPGFPLDGGRVLRALMWAVSGDLRRATRLASRVGQGIAWLMMTVGFAMALGLRVPLLGAGIVDGLWLAFVGWFLNNAALVSYRQLLVREALEHVPVRRLMQTQFRWIEPETPAAALLERPLAGSGQRAFPVALPEHRLLGMVSPADLHRIDREAAARTPVSAIMTPAAQLVALAPEQDALEALELLARHELGQLPVVEAGQILGLVRREDLLRWLARRRDDQAYAH